MIAYKPTADEQLEPQLINIKEHTNGHKCHDLSVRLNPGEDGAWNLWINKEYLY